MKDYPQHIFVALNDSAILKRLLTLAHNLEQQWSDLARRSHRLERLAAYLGYLKGHERLAELSKLEEKVATDMAPTTFDEVVGLIEQVARQSVADHEFLVGQNDRGERAAHPLTVVLHNVRSAYNVGAMFRTAEFLGVSRAILSGYTPSPEQAPVQKTAMGSEQWLPWKVVPELDAAISSLRETGTQLIGLETGRQSVVLREVSFASPCALFVGNERFGLDETTLKQMDVVAQIPGAGSKASLNVSTALALGCYEAISNLS